MAKNFAALAFTDAVKEMQEKMGSRDSYARMERYNQVDGLTENEVDFISQQTSFYMASIGENNFPYIQHRGGPKGFVKVLDDNRIGFIDFAGNKQYISVGNLTTNNNVAIIMVDYPSRTRLKILATAKIVELIDDSILYDSLDLSDYKFRPERMVVFNVEAYDWNCPQHIIPRYTTEDVEHALVPQRNYIGKLENEVIMLKAKLKKFEQK